MSNIICKIQIPTLKYIQDFCSWLSFLLGFKALTKPSEKRPQINSIKFKQAWRNSLSKPFGNSWSKAFPKAWDIPFAKASAYFCYVAANNHQKAGMR